METITIIGRKKTGKSTFLRKFIDNYLSVGSKVEIEIAADDRGIKDYIVLVCVGGKKILVNTNGDKCDSVGLAYHFAELINPDVYIAASRLRTCMEEMKTNVIKKTEPDDSNYARVEELLVNELKSLGVNLE